MECVIKPLFKRKRYLGLRAVILVLLSITLITANYQISRFAQLRVQLSMLVLPLQIMVDKPIAFFRWLDTSIATQQEILGENAQLRARQLLLEARLQRLLALEYENSQLRHVVISSHHLAGKTIIAQLLTVANDPLTQEVTLDKGSKSGVFVGQPVLDAYGAMGQIIQVTSNTSQAMLISDSRSAIPVQNNRNGMRSIIAGVGYADQLRLLHISFTADIAVGDTFITSGLGGQFPFGYPVGKVISIQKNNGERFAIVTVSPSAQLDKSRQVILLWPMEDSIPTPSMHKTNNDTKNTKKHQKYNQSTADLVGDPSLEHLLAHASDRHPELR